MYDGAGAWNRRKYLVRLEFDNGKYTVAVPSDNAGTEVEAIQFARRSAELAQQYNDTSNNVPVKLGRLLTIECMLDTPDNRNKYSENVHD